MEWVRNRTRTRSGAAYEELDSSLVTANWIHTSVWRSQRVLIHTRFGRIKAALLHVIRSKVNIDSRRCHLRRQIMAWRLEAWEGLDSPLEFGVCGWSTVCVGRMCQTKSRLVKVGHLLWDNARTNRRTMRRASALVPRAANLGV